MYARSKKIRYIKKHVRVLKANAKIQFKLMIKCSGKYLNSPLYRGSSLWDTLPDIVQRSLNIQTFMKHLKGKYVQGPSILNYCIIFGDIEQQRL